jgi:hypothetical protein
LREKLRMLERRWFLLLGMIFGMIVATAAGADPRDSVDRGQRLDTDALRDDVRTNRLQAPSHPLVIAPESQPAPVSRKKKKSNASSSGAR